MIVFEGGKKQFGCIIRDLSDGGAKLEVAGVKDIPQSFQLFVPGHRPQLCSVRWRALRELGVQFMTAA